MFSKSLIIKCNNVNVFIIIILKKGLLMCSNSKIRDPFLEIRDVCVVNANKDLNFGLHYLNSSGQQQKCLHYVHEMCIDINDQ